MAGSSYACLFTQIHFTLELSTWELELFTRLIMLRWSFDEFIWNDDDKLSVKVYNLTHVKSESSHSVGPEPMGFLAFFGLSRMLFCLVSFPL